MRLTDQGLEELSASLGRQCQPPQLRAIALGGPADALEMVAVPTADCLAGRFVLTPEVGAVLNEKRINAVRACTSPEPQLPCVVYPGTIGAALGASGP